MRKVLHMRFYTFIYLMTIPLSLTGQEYSGAIDYNYGTYHVPEMPDLTVHTLATNYSTDGWEFGAGARQTGLMYAAEQNSITELPDKAISISATATRKIRLKSRLSLQLSLQPQVNWADGNTLHGYNVIPGGEVCFRLRLTEIDSSGLFMGAGYGTTFGSPRFIPIVGYEWKTKNCHVIAGFPEILASFTFRARHIFSAWIKPTSLYTELPADRYSPSTAKPQKLSFEWVNISTGLSYAFRSEGGWETLFSIGKSLYQSADILGEKYRSTSSALQQSLSVSAGFNYKLNF